MKMLKILKDIHDQKAFVTARIRERIKELWLLFFAMKLYFAIIEVIKKMMEIVRESQLAR